MSVKSAAVPDQSTVFVSRLEYQPALDGVRALCLIAVLLFHADFEWMPGGFLGVSTFFTLSGFLITSLLVAENQRAGGISLGAFWERRLRRLAPAAILTIGIVVLSAPIWLPLAQRERLAGDALASLFFLVNWRFVQADYAYSLIFTAPSPFQHFWSLAIEAQFYLFYPILVGGALRSGLGASGLLVVLGALAALSVGLGFVPALSSEASHRLYYGSDARAAEILLGGLAALLLFRDGRVSPHFGWLGLPVLGLLVLAWCSVRVSDPRLYQGGLLIYTVGSVMLIRSAMVPGPTRWLLSPGWLRWVGRDQL